MHHEFWLERWQQNQIGFHADDINPYLLERWSELAIAEGSSVFVPLCGKSKDMLWLMAQGYKVLGIELSPLAVNAFFTENALQPVVRQHGVFVINEIDGLQVLCGDYCDLQTADLGRIDVVYDRAALVAMPDNMREAYVSRLAALTTAGVKILLISCTYPELEMQGPPFSISQAEVEKLYGDWCEIELLLDEDTLEREPRFKQRGLTRMREQVYRLTVR